MLRIRQAIQSMQTYHPPLQGRGEALRLDFNENVDRPSPAIIKALREMTPAKLSIYPDDTAATEAAAAYYGVSPEHVILTNGGDEAIQCLVNLLVESGDRIPVFEPTYAMYRIYLSIAGAEIQPVLYEEDLSFPYDRLQQALSEKPKLVFLCSPNNPTGTEMNYQWLRNTIQANPTTAFVVDEAYGEFTEQTLLQEACTTSNLFVLRTFSKAFGLASLRLGAVIAMPENITWLLRVRSPYSISRISLFLLQAALADSNYMNNYVTMVSRNRKQAEDWFVSKGIQTWPSAGNFLLVKVGDRVGDICAALAAKGILVRSRGKDPLLQGCFRLTIGPDEVMEKFYLEFEPLL